MERPAVRSVRWSGARPWLLLSTGLIAWFGLLARFRLVDADEGWELLAARLVAAGARPYLDFFTQQMPLLPWVYGAWGRIAAFGWGQGRALSALLAATGGLLVARIAGRATGRAGWGWVAAALFASNALVFTWLPVVKTYALTTVLLLGAWDVLAAGPDRSWRWTVAGILAGLAVETRLYVLVVVPWLCPAGSARRRAKGGHVRYAAGVALALIPAIRLGVADPARWWFMNVGYHLTRTDAGWSTALGQKLGTVLTLGGLSDEGGAAGSQMLLLSVLAAALGWRARARPVPRPVVIAALLGLISLIPTPAFIQYFCLAVPFLILGLVEWMAAAGADDPARPGRALLIAMAAAYGLAVPSEWHRGVVSGADLVIDERPAGWSLKTVEAVAGCVDRETAAAGEPVLSWWPGYLVGSRAAPVPGMENQFALSAALRVAPDRRLAWHLPDPHAVALMLRAGRPRLCVVGGWMLEMPDWAVRRHLAACGYRVVATVETIEVWRRGPRASAASAAPP